MEGKAKVAKQAALVAQFDADVKSNAGPLCTLPWLVSEATLMSGQRASLAEVATALRERLSEEAVLEVVAQVWANQH